MISIIVSAALMIGEITGEPQQTAHAQPEKISCLDGLVKHRFGTVEPPASWARALAVNA